MPFMWLSHTLISMATSDITPDLTVVRVRVKTDCSL